MSSSTATSRSQGLGQGSTVTGSHDSCSERSGEVSWAKPIAWEQIHLGQRIQPYRGYAHCTDDIYLLGCFLELTRVSDVDGDSLKLLLRALKLLRRCNYSFEDICCILTHASVYFHDADALCGSHMDASEVGNVLVTLMFIAHSYVQDETCPLHIWHQHLFRKYCPSLRTLNAAVIRLLEIRRFKLRLDTTDLIERYTQFIHAVQQDRPATMSADGKAVAQQPNPLEQVLDYCKYH
eukprot:NODE_455_length_1551_cov_314.905749.p1 GENE.NODE_455_length_1551_cov_314.905749~~NODE_455_length_1551_cov_314.905749.p1  ORF type:complete len:236 (+),score=48.47 NODE_455_length_1551_cov_314.905749:55-762(+)